MTDGRGGKQEHPQPSVSERQPQPNDHAEVIFRCHRPALDVHRCVDVLRKSITLVPPLSVSCTIDSTSDYFQMR